MNEVCNPLKPAIDTAPRYAALAHPARLEILQHLAHREACCCKDVVSRMNLAQSTVSQHLKILVEAGLVTFATDRTRSCYRLNREALADLSSSLDGLVRYCCAPR